MSYEQSFICALVFRIKTEVVGTYSFFSQYREKQIFIDFKIKKKFKDFQPFDHLVLTPKRRKMIECPKSNL